MKKLLLLLGLGLSIPLINMGSIVPVSSLTNDLVSSKYPNAYQWYRDMATKYPKENLENIEFYFDPEITKQTGHSANDFGIYFPEHHLETIEKTYKRPWYKNLVKPMSTYPLEIAESLILHEAYHTQENYGAKLNFVNIGVSMLAGYIYFSYISPKIFPKIRKTWSSIWDRKNKKQAADHVEQNKNDIDNKTSIDAQKLDKKITTAAQITTIILFYATIYAILRTKLNSTLLSRFHSEPNADNNAHTKASKEALMAYINFWSGFIKANKFSSNPIVARLQATYRDPSHPTPHSRLNAAQAAYNQRFGSA